jgi:outer membrane protein assembly factor BamE
MLLPLTHSSRARCIGPRSLALVGLLLALGGCQHVPILPGLTPYQLEIQQGNVLTPEMVAKLKPGMTRQQVRFVLGTPPITDAFHPDRWDYVYYVRKQGQIAEHRRLILLFDGDTLKRIEGDPMPLADNTPKAGEKAPEAQEKGMFGRLLEGMGL